MEQISSSKKHTLLACTCSLVLHVVVIITIFSQSLKQSQGLLLPLDDANATYLVEQVLSAGEQQPAATVLFQSEPLSGDAIVPASGASAMQEEQEIEQQAIDQTSPPLDQQEEPATTFESFAEPIPTAQTAEQPAAQAIPEQSAHIQTERRTTNKNSISLTDIARGFIKSMQQEAGHNKAKAQQDMKQLALQIYASKLWHIITQSFLAGDNGLHLPEDVSVKSILTLTVDRTGKLMHIFLDYPHRIAALKNIERLIISRAHQAGLFPPLPEHIPGTSKTFSFPLLIEGQKGFHAYSLGYR